MREWQYVIPCKEPQLSDQSGFDFGRTKVEPRVGQKHNVSSRIDRRFDFLTEEIALFVAAIKATKREQYDEVGSTGNVAQDDLGEIAAPR